MVSFDWKIKNSGKHLHKNEVLILAKDDVHIVFNM